jgi:4-amino-4-deoxy-L-arabinose transferase-like glycosyltransferase
VRNADDRAAPASDKTLWLHLLAVCGVTALLGLPSLLYPFGFDQANHAFIAHNVLQGEVLYRDVPSLKPPLTTAFHGLALAAFGHSMTSIRIADLAWSMASAALVTLFARRAFGRERTGLSLLAGVCYAHFYYNFNYWHTAQTDGWMNLPITAAMLWVLDEWRAEPRAPARRALSWAAIGAASAVALLFKYTALGFLPVLALAALAPGLGDRRRIAWSLGGLCAGLVAALALSAAALSAWGAWDAYVDRHLATVMAYSARAAPQADAGGGAIWVRVAARLLDVREALPFLAAASRTYLLGACGALLALVWVGRRATRPWLRRCLLLTLGWLAAGWASTAVQARFFGYHLFPMLPAWSLLAALFAASLAGIPWRRFRAPWQRTVMVLLAVAALCWANLAPTHYELAPHPAQMRQLLRVVSGGQTLEDNWKSPFYRFTPSFSVRDTLEAAEWVAAHTEDDDPLFVWGTNLGVYFLTQRPRVSRISTSLEASGSPIFATGDAGPERLLRDFRRRPPRIVLIQHGDAIPHILGHRKDSHRMLVETREVFRFLRQHYDHVDDVGRFNVLRVKSGWPQP